MRGPARLHALPREAVAEGPCRTYTLPCRALPDVANVEETLSRLTH